MEDEGSGQRRRRGGGGGGGAMSFRIGCCEFQDTEDAYGNIFLFRE